MAPFVRGRDRRAGEKRDDEPAEGRRPLEVRRVPSALDHLEPGPGDPMGDEGRPLATDRVETPDHDEGRCANLAKATMERIHRSLPGAAESIRQTARGVPEALPAETRPRRGRERAMAREDRLALPAVDEGADPVALDRLGQGLVGDPATVTLAGVGDPSRGALEDEPPDGGRVIDGEPESDPGPHRVAQHVGDRRPDGADQRG